MIHNYLRNVVTKVQLLNLIFYSYVASFHLSLVFLFVPSMYYLVLF